MIIFNFRGKIFILDSIILGLSAYTVAVLLMWLLKRKDSKKKNFLSNSIKERFLQYRGGDSKTRAFLYKNIKANVVYEIKDVKLSAYIRGICKVNNRSELLIIDPATLSYALRNYEKLELKNHQGRRILKILKPIQLFSSILIGFFTGMTSFIILGILYTIIIGVLGCVVYISPINGYSPNILDACIQMPDNISIVLSENNCAPVVFTSDVENTEIVEYLPLKTIISEEGKENNASNQPIVIDKSDSEKVHKIYSRSKKRGPKVRRFLDMVREFDVEEAEDALDAQN